MPCSLYLAKKVANHLIFSVDTTDDSVPALPDPRIIETLKAFKKPSVAELAWKRISKKATSEPGHEAERAESVGPRPTGPTPRPTLMQMASFSPQVLEEVYC